jgi:hypothetical protein
MVKAACMLTFLCCLMFCRCATTQGERQDRSLGNWWPRGSQWRDAAVNAARHPGTWVPAMGAVVIAAGGWDRDISDWAIAQRPIFGSHEAAQDASDILRSSAQLALTALAAGTAWARIEAGQHYPTDVLAGAALGNFIAILIHDAFLSQDVRSEFSLLTGADKSVILGFEIRF